jgi:transposase
VGASQRRTLAGSTAMLPFSRDVLASIPGVDAQRRLGKGMGATTSEVGRTRSSRPLRDVRRRHILACKKRGELVGKTKRGKGTKIMVLADGHGIPLGATIASASPHEVTLIEHLLNGRVIRRRPQRLIYDLAADSDPLRERLARRGIELVCPHRRNRKKPPTQDGRSFRRYCRRWKIERAIGWLQYFRRLVTRYEYHAYLFQGFVQIACLIIVLRQF